MDQAALRPVYLRPDAGRLDPGYYLQEDSGYQILVQYKVIRLSQQGGQAVLDSGYVGLLPFAPLMQPPAGQAPDARLDQCVAKAVAVPLERSVKADFLTGLAILSGLVYNPQTIMAIVSKEHLMDLTRESSFAQYLAESAREQGLKQGIEQGLRQSIQEVLKCWHFTLIPAQRNPSPRTWSPSTMCNGSRTCIGRRYRHPRRRPSNAGSRQRRRGSENRWRGPALCFI